MLLEDGKGEGKERAASGISFSKDRGGVLLERPRNQYEHMVAPGVAGLSQFTLKFSFCKPLVSEEQSDKCLCHVLNVCC